MGGLSIHGTVSSVYTITWTGGEPNSTWTGLKDPTAMCVDPYQTQSNSPKAASSYERSQAGLFPVEEEERFSKGDILYFFIKKLQIAVKDIGMDSIGYRCNPADPSTMVNVLELYPCLNQSEIKEESECASPNMIPMIR